MKPSGAHTHPGSGSGIGAAVAVVLAAAVVASIAGPAVAAVTALLRLVLIAAGVILGLALAAVGALVAWRLRQGRAHTGLGVPPPTPAVLRPAESLSAPQPPALERPAELHLHLYGVSAEEVAAILRDRRHLPGG